MKRARNALHLLFALVLGAGALSAGAGRVAAGSVPPGLETHLAAPTPSEPEPPEPVVRRDIRHDTSPALSSIQPIPPGAGPSVLVLPRLPLHKTGNGSETAIPLDDPVLQDRSSTATLMPSPIRNFEGVNNRNGVLPPDTQGDVGPNHYVQWVNLSFAVWDKTGNLLYGPADGNTLWSGFGGPCETTNDGDPITLYDHLADRWLMSQFALPNYPSGPFYECIAISQTPDPTGLWHRYAFLASNTKMNDYPKFGVWPDGYYMTVNQFVNGSSWGGAGVFAFERDKMLLGQSAQMVYFDLYSVDSDFGGMLPSDLDGSTLPPAGAPNYFVEVDDATWIPPADALRLWEFHVDWTTPADSTFGLSGQPNGTVNVASFTPLCTSTMSCIPQPGTSVGLDAIGDRLMFRLAYRNMDTHESLVVNHTVNVGAGRAGIRWYEVRDPGSTPVIYQQGTFAPADGLYRWMGSAAMDRLGNIAVGYSVSSSSVYPSIRYTGRLVDDPPGTMGQGEVEIVAGSGSQTSSYFRWGDYSMMAVDPMDDCTFWYTQEYVQTTGNASWQTRIGSFRFPDCTPEGQGTLAGTVQDSATLDPIVGAQVRASSGPTQTFETTSGARGAYTLTLASRTYTATGSAYGYYPDETAGVSVSEGMTTSLDILLTPAPAYVVSGTVTDAVTGWPLYARIDVDGYGGRVVWNDPVTGFYSVTLAGETPYTFNVHGWADGYLPGVRSVGPLAADVTVNLALNADASACDAPGYVMGAGCHPSPGGLVVGNVYGGHTGEPLIGATVANDSGDSATAAVTADPAVDDGFYTLFSPAGTHAVTATHYHYGPGVASPTVVQSDTIRQDLELPAGRLSYSPAGLAITLTWGASLTLPLTLTNVGDVAASFELVELEPAAGPLGPFQTPDAIVKPFKQSFSTTRRIKLPDLPAAPPYPAGAVIRSWPAGVQNGWGIALAPSQAGNGEAGAVWLASPSARWGGDNRFYEYMPGGTPTGRFHPFAWGPPFGPADGAVNWHTGMLWVMNIDSPGSNNCIYEVDPARGYTGDRICPAGNGFANSQRGLAYDPADDTWYAGGWNDRTIHHFDSAGTVLQSVDVGLGISGLAYNPDTRHLFVMTNDDASPVFVLDVAGGYAPVGQFSVGAGLGSYGGAGLEFDCAGNLWAVDQATDTVYQFASGETTALCQYDLSWLSADPVTGTVGPASGQVVSVTFDAGPLDVPDWGIHYARLKIEHDTPYSLTDVPLTMTVEPPPPSLTITKTLAPDPAGIGIPLRYTVTVSNAGGPATGVTISDTLPAGVQFASASHGGVLVVGDVVWGGLSVAGVSSLFVAYTATVDCVSPGTSIANVAYQVAATEWPTPVLGEPVTVTAVTPDVIAGLDFPTPVVRGNPVRFANLSRNSAVYEWDFGDGLTSTLSSPTHAYAAIGTYTVTLMARTLCGGSDQASQALTAHDYGGTIWPATATGEADPGIPFTHTLQLTNTGTLSDSFDLSLGTHGWDTGLSSSRVGPLAPGEPGSFEVTVIAAPEALAGDWDRVIVTATAVSDPRAPRVVTSSTLTTTANPVYDVTLFPAADSRSGVPGTAVVYFLQAINTGNAGDAYTLSRLGGEWPISILPSGSFTLAASAQQAVLVQVTVPVTATAVEWDVSEVQVLASSGATNTSRLTTSVACVGSGGASFTYVPASPVAGERVVFTGSVGIGTPPITYTWDFGDGSPLLVRGGGAAGGEAFTHTYGTPDVYRAVMTATNCYGASTSSAAHVVTVGDAPDITVQPASLAATLSPGEAGAVTLTIGNVGMADLSWTLAPVPVVDWLDVTKTGGDLPPLGNTDVAITFTAPPTTAVPAYTATLHVSSNDPDRPHVTVPVTLTVVEGCEKIAGVGFTYRPAIPMVGQAVVFTGTAAGGTAHLPVTYTWDFGDGSPPLTVGIGDGTAGGSVVTHTFPLTTTVRIYTGTMGVANPCSGPQLVQKSITVYPYRVLLPTILKEEP